MLYRYLYIFSTQTAAFPSTLLISSTHLCPQRHPFRRFDSLTPSMQCNGGQPTPLSRRPWCFPEHANESHMPNSCTKAVLWRQDFARSGCVQGMRSPSGRRTVQSGSSASLPSALWAQSWCRSTLISVSKTSPMCWSTATRLPFFCRNVFARMPIWTWCRANAAHCLLSSTSCALTPMALRPITVSWTMLRCCPRRSLTSGQHLLKVAHWPVCSTHRGPQADPKVRPCAGRVWPSMPRAPRSAWPLRRRIAGHRSFRFSIARDAS